MRISLSDHGKRYPLVNVGKCLHKYGTSPCFIDKFTISMAIFNSFLYVYQVMPGFPPVFDGQNCHGRFKLSEADRLNRKGEAIEALATIFFREIF